MAKPLPFIFNHSHHTLKVDYLSLQFDVLTFQGTEGLSQTFHYAIEFTSPDGDIAADTLLGQPASFSLHTAPHERPRIFAWQPVVEIKPLRTLNGVITGFKRLSGSADEARYEVTLEPRFALLGRGQQFRIYQHQSVPQIVESILRDRHDMLGQDFFFKLLREYPRREQVMQYGESDLAFVSRLLADVGIWYRIARDERLDIDVVEFHDDQLGYQFDVGVVYCPPSGLSSSGRDAVWNLQSHHQVVEKHVSVRTHQHRSADTLLQGDIDRSRRATTTYGEAYHYAEPYQVMGEPSALDDDMVTEGGYFYARMRHERYLNGRTRLSGDSSNATLAPGQVLTIKDAPAQAFLPCVVITQLRTRAARDRSFEVSFEAIPYTMDVCFRPALPDKPQIAGTVPARVTSTRLNDPYGHIDIDGRYKVNFLFDRDTWQLGGESLWLRMARPYAGDKHGLHLPLIAGTEVAIAFEQGDPDRPYIAHALHDSQHPDHVTLRNYRRNVLRTPANNKLRMEDTRGQEHVKLSTEYGGKSQLNLGHLVDAERKQRGDGFELRTDSWGSIRAGKGLFISADEQTKAQGQVLEMSAAVGRLQQAGEQLERVSADAQAANADPADVQAQMIFLREQLEELKAAVLLLSAPEGIALTSGKHLQLAAQNNLMINAGAEADVSVVKRLFIGVGQGLSLFVRKLGIKLIANQGPVSIQAQNDKLELTARHGLNITSTEDEIHIVAKKKITLNAGGSYITLDAGCIESGTQGDHNVKAVHFDYRGPASMGATHPIYPDGQPKQPLQLNIQQAPNTIGQGWAGMPYTLYADGAVLKQGVLDNTGHLLIDHQVVTRGYRLVMANGMSYQIPVPTDYRNAEQAHLANRGIHNHRSQTDTQVSQPTSHTDHRALYATAVSPTHDQEGKTS